MPQTQWKFTLERSVAGGTTQKDILKEAFGAKQEIVDVNVRVAQNKNVTQVEVLENKAWAFAKSPLGQLPMMFFIFWMTGSGISIYTIMFTIQMAMGPFKGLFNTNAAFEQFEHKDLNLLMPKLVYAACNCVSIVLALYKFSNMGIIPVQPADWAGLFQARHAIESSQVLM